MQEEKVEQTSASRNAAERKMEQVELEEVNQQEVNQQEGKEKKIGYRDILGQKEYMKMICANIINRFGDSVDSIAITWIIYAITKSAAWSAFIYGVNYLPTILFQPFFGAAIEKMDKKKVMVVTDLIRGGIMVLFLWMYLSGLLNPWILTGLMVSISTVEAFRVPAGTAMVPQLLDKECYTFGISLSSSSSYAVELIGIGAAGIILSVFGSQAALLVDITTFFLSAVIITTIHPKKKEELESNVDRNKNEEEENQKEKKETYLETLKEGIQYVVKKPIIRNLCLYAFILNGMLVPFNSLEAVIVSDVLGQGAQLISVMGAALSISLLLGSAIYPYIAGKIKINTLCLLCGLAMGICCGVIGIVPRIFNSAILIYGIISIIYFVIGSCVSLLSSNLSVNFMKEVEQSYMARAGAIFNAGAMAAMPVVSFLISIFSSKISTTSILLVTGGFCVLYHLVIRVIGFQMESEKTAEPASD